MEAIRRQASKLREQVAKQQQAVLKQLGRFGNETTMIDDVELQCHRLLHNLYNSTRVSKHFQRDIVRAVEGFISTSCRQMEIMRKLTEDCCKFGNENRSAKSPLARVALHFGTSRSSMEEERETLIAILGDQVSEPLRSLVAGAPLEDARHLTHRYDSLRQEVEVQAAEVLRRQSKSKDPGVPSETSTKLQSAEAKLVELKSAMMALGREATAAMLAVESQQQRITLERLLMMVDAERSYHQSIVSILEKLHAKMILEKQRSESSSQSLTMQRDVHPTHEDTYFNGSNAEELMDQNDMHFIAKVIHPFDAQADGELTLSIDDYIVVRQVAPNGWSEGECKGRAGWFPSAYIERQDKAPASKILETGSSP
ncbi:SH3 domain-containing protein 2-like isoform X1 [Malania oleifera]|uniref:SH3 domain-containing protein 2-like isoform X1 n=1 Tax=Malania oleifera TaxID=397392 RepID=UPI0025AE641E|nr:SH3 domain-containing protein 2-like isoform X1 [Malania oleifera]XP_057965145.1 SH3 domain-containing protein 2-like isoform X1 [Malania oleifera]